MAQKCAVRNCCNVFKPSLNISFHKFPKNPDIFQHWKNFCQREAEWEPDDSSYICSIHFNKEDFDSNSKNGQRNGLSSTKMILESNSDTSVLTNRDGNCEPIVLRDNKTKELMNEIAEKNRQIENLKQELKTEKSNNDKFYSQLLSFQSVYKDQTLLINKQKREIKNMEETYYSPKEFEQALKDRLDPSLASSNQFEVVLVKEKKRWTKTEIYSSFKTFRHLGKRRYLYVKNQLKIPLAPVGLIYKIVTKKNLTQTS